MRSPLWAILALTFCAAGVGRAAPEPPDGDSLRIDPADTLGFVYAYGVALEPPFIFSGVGSDTLRLNGVPLLPRRCEPEAELPAEEAARVQVLRNASRAFASAADHRAGLDSAAAVFRAAGDNVDAVDHESHRIEVVYDLGKVSVDFSEATLGSAEERRLVYQQHQVQNASRTIRKGRAFAFGCTYVIWASDAETAWLREVLARPQNERRNDLAKGTGYYARDFAALSEDLEAAETVGEERR